jgi:monovalent cation/hydrogen antiporter
MLELLAFVLAAVTVIVAAQLVANRTGLPAAALLTLAGLLYAVLPGPNLILDPRVILTFVIPPLIYSAALNSSLTAIRKNLRTVISLSIGLVLATAVLTGVSMWLLVPQVGLAAGIALGAAIAPTDPVAALALGGGGRLSARLVTLIEGEGLLNDATALTTLTVAVTAVTSGRFSFGEAVGHFLLAAVGGLLAGVAVAFAIRGLRRAITDPLLVNALSLATPFAAYLLGEAAHVSGVLAVAVAGLMIGHDTPRFTSGASRLQTSAVWRLADFLLQGFVFLLIGQQIVPVLHGLHAYSPGTIITAVAVSLAATVLLRPVWLVVMTASLRAVPARLTAREIGVLSWAGTRGVISLAAIFTVPLAVSAQQPFPGRDLLLFCTFLVVIVTLVGQGLTFGLVTRLLGVRADPADEASLRWEARAAAVRAGLARLDQLAASAEIGGPALATLRVSLEHGEGLYRRQSPLAADDDAALQARREVIDAQREELLRWRDAGHLPDASLRVLQRELDHEERTLPPHGDH